jgi:hypothetical protein
MALTRAKTKAGGATKDKANGRSSYERAILSRVESVPVWRLNSASDRHQRSPLAEARLSSVSGRASCWWNAHMAAVLGLADRLALNS